MIALTYTVDYPDWLLALVIIACVVAIVAEKWDRPK
jgi:hypothetical protein